MKANIAVLGLLLSLTSAMRMRYKSDDMDDLLEGVITNKHHSKEDQTPKGPID